MLGRKRKATDFSAEIQEHLQLEIERLREEGLSEEEAQAAARRTFGNVTCAEERFYEFNRWLWWDRLRQDIRFGVRILTKKPGFTAVAVITLALGIGANTLIFSVVEALMLRPLPFATSDQLVRIYSTQEHSSTGRSGNLLGPSPPDVHDFAQDSHSFQKMVAYDIWRKNVRFAESAGEPEQMRVGLVPAAYFEILDIHPILGRLFTEEENQEGKNYVAAISARLWRNRFAGDDAIVGRKIRINDEPYTIVGVMPDVIPEWMEPGPGPVWVWTPFAFSDVWSETARGGRGDSAVARMKPGVSLEQAQADLATIAARLSIEHPVDQGIGVAIQRISDTRVGKLRPLLFLLMAAVSLILLIACVNLANLLLARNSTRQRELALRAALGARRRELVRQLLAETLLLSLVGGAVGLALARIGITALTRMRPEGLPQLGSIGIDWRVLAFTLFVSVLTSLLFGLAPAITGTQVDLVKALTQGGRSGTSGPTSQRLRHGLVVTEVAMSLMLLVGASLLLRSILRLEGQGLGIRQDHLLKGHIFLPGVRYPNPEAITRFCDNLATRVRAVPGVVDATVTTVYPPRNGWTQMLNIPGHPATRIQDIPSAEFGLADAHFLKTLGIPLIRGRDFAESDNAGGQPVALISEEFKRRYFQTVDPIGQRIHIGPPPVLQIVPGRAISDSADVTIIGIIGNFKNAGLPLPAEPQITVLYSQHPLVNYGFKDIVIRTALPPRQLEPEIRRQLHALDSDMPFAQVQTMDELVEAQTGGQRFTAVLLTAFAIAGLVLSIVGIYGVVSFLVVQRKQELAVRIALGASHGAVLWLVLQQTMKMATLGAALGLGGAWASQKLTRGLLFGISPIDPSTLTGAAVFLLSVAIIASAIPAARVLRIDPAGALRQD